MLKDTVLEVSPSSFWKNIVVKSSEPSRLVLATTDAQILLNYGHPQKCMDFTAKQEWLSIRNCIDDLCRDEPNCLKSTYTQTMALATSLHPKPVNVLNIGLGGAALPKFHLQVYKTLHPKITSVEIDPNIIQY